MCLLHALGLILDNVYRAEASKCLKLYIFFRPVISSSSSPPPKHLLVQGSTGRTGPLVMLGALPAAPPQQAFSFQNGREVIIQHGFRS